MRLGTIGYRVPDVAGVGFRPTGELVAFTEDLSLYVWPADGTSKPKVTLVAGKKQMGPRRALSADGQFAAAFLWTKQERRLVVWDVSGEHSVEYLSRDAGDVYKLAFSPNGSWLVVNDSPPHNGVLLLCNLSAKTWAQVPYPGGHVESLSFTPDGKSLVVATSRDVAVIDTAAGTERCRVAIPKGRPAFAALSPDGAILAVEPVAFVHGPEPTMRLLSVPSGEDIANLKPPSGSAHWVSFAPDGKTILLGGPYGIREWDPTSGKLVREIPGPATYPPVFAPDHRRLASHSSAAVLFWDTVNHRHVRPELADAGHTETILGVTVSPDGELIATNALDGEIRMWDARTGRTLCSVRSKWSNDRCVAFLPDSKSFIAVAEDYVTPVVREVATGRELRRLSVPPDMAKAEMTNDLRLSADGKTLTISSRPVRVGGKTYTVRWDVDTGRLVERTEAPGDWSKIEMGLSTYSPDGRWFVERGILSRVGVQESVRLIAPIESGTVRATFSTDSRFVAVARAPSTVIGTEPEQGSVVIFDLPSRTKVAEVPMMQPVRSAFSADARYLAVVGRQEIVLWELASAAAVRRFPVERGLMVRPCAIAFTPDGRRLITGEDDCSALVWDLTGTGRAAGEATRPLSADAIRRIWDALAGDDAAQASTAGWELSDRRQQAIAILRERLKPIQAADEAIVRALVAKLDAPVFADREAADKELGTLGDSAVPALRPALKAGLSTEQAQRVERLLAALKRAAPPSGRAMWELRGVQVLERIGSPEAKALLKELAGGVDGARLTIAAKEALGRLREE